MIQTQEEFILNPPNEALKKLVTWCPGLVAHDSAVFTRWLLRQHAHLHPPSGGRKGHRGSCLGSCHQPVLNVVCVTSTWLELIVWLHIN